MWRTLAIVAIVPLGACSSGFSLDGQGNANAEADAKYSLSTKIHLETLQLPGGYDEAIRALEGMQEDPAGTLIYVLEQTNPAAAQALDFIPGPVMGKFKEWVNEYVFSRVFEGLPAADQFGELAEQASAMFRVIQLDTRLDGAGEGTHELDGVGFELYGSALVIATEDVGIEEQIVTTGVEVARDGDALSIGAHGLDVPIGPYAALALDTALMVKFGADLEGLVRDAIDCDGLAAEVSDKCVTVVTQFCVGHESELRDFCEAGATAVADYVHGRIRDLSIEAELQSGHAVIAGAAVEDGVWDAQINMGLGDMAPEATFVGRVMMED